jgi:hypothetical protein
MKWAFVNLMMEPDGGALEKDFIDEMSALTDHFTNVVITMQINGRPMDPAHMFQRLEENMEWQVKREARRMLDGAPRFDRLRDLLEEVEGQVTAKFREALREIGIETEDED